MEPIGQIVQKPSMLAPQSSLIVSAERRELIEDLILRMAIETHTPEPGPDRMLILVEGAVIQWRGISDADLPLAVAAGLKDSGNWMPSAGKVADSWEKLNAPKALELGAGVRHLGVEVREKMDGFDAYWNSLTEEERAEELEFRAKVCRESMAKLVGGAA